MNRAREARNAGVRWSDSRYQVPYTGCQVPKTQVPRVKWRVSGARIQLKGSRCEAAVVRCDGRGSQRPCFRFQGSGATSKCQKLSH